MAFPRKQTYIVPQGFRRKHRSGHLSCFRWAPQRVIRSVPHGSSQDPLKYNIVQEPSKTCEVTYCSNLWAPRELPAGSGKQGSRKPAESRLYNSIRSIRSIRSIPVYVAYVVYVVYVVYGSAGFLSRLPLSRLPTAGFPQPASCFLLRPPFKEAC